MAETWDLSTPEGRAKAEAAGYPVPAGKHRETPHGGVSEAGQGRHEGQVILTLPWPPTENHLKVPVTIRSKKTGQLITRLVPSKETKDYVDEVARIVCGAGRPHIAGRVRVELNLYPKDGRRFDLDNTRKAINDALVKAGVIEDDYLIWHDEARKHSPDGSHTVQVVISALEGQLFPAVEER